MQMQIFLVVFLLGIQTGTLASLLPCLNLTPGPLAFGFQLVIASTEFSNGLFSQELLQSPLLNILRLILLKLGDEGNSTL